MAKKEEKQEQLTKAGTTALANFDYGEDAVTVDSKEVGRGYEHQGKADVSIPWMTLQQPQSPLVLEGKARMGDWVNTVSGEVFKKEDGFDFVAGTTRHMFTEWVPRDKGGGFRGQHEVESEIVARGIKNSAKFGKYQTDEGNQLVETFYVYGALCRGPEVLGMAAIAFSSTKIKAYKAWMTRLRSAVITDPQDRKVRPPLYGHFTHVGSKDTKNEKGTFAIPVLGFGSGDLVSSLLRPDDERFQTAKACMQLVDSGEAKIDYSKQKTDGEDDTTEPAAGDTSFNFSR